MPWSNPEQNTQHSTKQNCIEQSRRRSRNVKPERDLSHGCILPLLFSQPVLYHSSAALHWVKFSLHHILNWGFLLALSWCQPPSVDRCIRNLTIPAGAYTIKGKITNIKHLWYRVQDTQFHIELWKLRVPRRANFLFGESHQLGQEKWQELGHKKMA